VTTPSVGAFSEAASAVGDGATVVVVGASVAGVRVAQGLRRERFTGRIILIGDEGEDPYDKPPLSKQHLTGAFGDDRIRLLDPAAAAAEGIETRLGVAAAGLDVDGRRVLLADGTHVDYDACVVATGASARPSPWNAQAGVHLLRTRRDSDSLRDALLPEATLVVVGGGFIGAEVAASAASLGCMVTVVDPLETPAGRLLGDEVGGILAGVHDAHGVDTRFGMGVASIEEVAGGLDVRLADGTSLMAAAVVVGIGAVPNDSWMQGSGLTVSDGLVCDEYCRALDAPGVFAAGDVARWFHPDRLEATRVEHWTNAVEQAACVVHNLVNPHDMRSYRPVEYVWSDQYDWKIQIVGRPRVAEGHRLIGDTGVSRPRWAALYVGGTGSLVGAVTVNWPRASIECRRRVAAGEDFAGAVAAMEALASASR
jgi:phthalate 3,4-dioxygenase ferredoxin reductase subunit